MNTHTSEKTIMNIFVKINLRSRKWLLSYSPSTNLIADHLHCIGRGIDLYSISFLLYANLNIEISNSFLEQFCASSNLKSLIKEPTCFKSVDNPSCIDPPKCFQNFGVYETSISTVAEKDILECVFT